MMRRLQTALMVAVISGICIGALPAFAASDLDRGADLYKNGQFQAASEAFVDAICQRPRHYAAHYALANAYMKLGKMSEAQTEYELCLEMSPDSVTKSNCHKALGFLAGSTKGPEPVSQSPERLDSMLAADGQRRAQLAQNAAAAQKAAIESKAANTAARIQENAKLQIESMKANSAWWTVDRFNGKGMVPVVPWDIQNNVTETAEKQAEFTMNTAKSRAAEIQPALGTTDATDGLRSQLNSTGNSGVRLSPVGTNIYVRNYASTQVAGKSGGDGVK